MPRRKKKEDSPRATAKEDLKKIGEMEKEISELRAELNESKDKYLRLFAEFENFKKRNLRERLDLLKTAAEDTMISILPVLDDFDRAKQSAEDDNSSEVFSEGVQLVYNKIYNVLAARGLKPMETNGTLFDPDLHEAISEIPAGQDKDKGKIIDTVEKGYYLNDKIIRHAKVVVGK